MKLLLTSGGLTNKSISKALHELVGKPFQETKLAFIPTAANVESGDKSWLIKDIDNCSRLKFKAVDIVDISALPSDIWKQRIEQADVILFGGGNTFHLLYSLKKSGLDQLLPKLLKSKVYVGISAGSIAVTGSLELSRSERKYSSKIPKSQEMLGLNLVSFQIQPHLDSNHFPKIEINRLKKIAKKTSQSIFALDDKSAIKVDNGLISVISEGVWKKID